MAGARKPEDHTRDKTEIRRLAREVFGFEDLRPEQEDAVLAVLGGHDTLVVMPTGSGKSAIYQTAALLLDGPTVVVSPLIALQLDQVEGLDELDQDADDEQNAGAAALNSTLNQGERRELMATLAAGQLEFLFLAPEQFAAGETLERLQAAQPSLFVVDEAHCISEWGHDFRPDYLRLGAAVEALGHPTVLALTATAAPPVRNEIISRLRMRQPRVVIHGFERPNIELAVESFHDDDEKRARLLDATQTTEKPGIVYAATRKHTMEVAEALNERGIPAAAYHAGLPAAERERVQNAFMNDELAVIVATTAFGMGVDKPNVRFVHHLDVPGSIDAYYQQIGRAGRDGSPARATLYYRPDDLNLQRFLAGSSLVTREDLERVAAAVAAPSSPQQATALREQVGLSDTKLTLALTHLEEAGALRLQPKGYIVPLPDAPSPAEAAEEAERAQERRKTFEKSRLEMMRGYATTDDCRRAYLLNYFGQPYQGPCGHCDNCRAGTTSATPDTRRQPFPIGSRVKHPSFGAGQVMRYEQGKMTVLFDAHGYQTLAVDVVLDNDLLAPAA
ncbi:MAG TPA: ATP-dependent DNA helicase RecQ [Trueperaceae bacterium]